MSKTTMKADHARARELAGEDLDALFALAGSEDPETVRAAVLALLERVRVPADAADPGEARPLTAYLGRLDDLRRAVADPGHTPPVGWVAQADACGVLDAEPEDLEDLARRRILPAFTAPGGARRLYLTAAVAALRDGRAYERATARKRSRLDPGLRPGRCPACGSSRVAWVPTHDGDAHRRRWVCEPCGSHFEGPRMPRAIAEAFAALGSPSLTDPAVKRPG